MEIHDIEQWDITVHKVSEGQYHCWFESDDDVPPEVEDILEDIEAEFFTQERANDHNIIDHLPTEGEYTHEPVKIGVVRLPADGSAPEFELDFDYVYEKLKEHGYY